MNWPMSKAASKTRRKDENKARKQPAAPPAKPAEPEGELSEAQQKAFIVQNGQILNPDVGKQILWIVMDEVGEHAAVEKKTTNGIPETNIRLDVCTSGVIKQIYRIMRARLDALNRPAGGDAAAGRG
ncbi:MAG: hypothetical protein KGL39_09330 [Patescibacteria group bacterium]|nr:hypothetical protein [Patescibacteria group bacterium]